MTTEQARAQFPVGSVVYVWGEHHKVLDHRDTALGPELRLERPASRRSKAWRSWVRVKAVQAHRRARGLV